MEPYLNKTKPGTICKPNDRTKAMQLKSELYLKYTLLVELMKIVKKHGRDPHYEWENDCDLSLIKKGDFGEEAGNDNIKQILAFDGFTTIWLLTLPEKFKEWYDYHLKITKIYQALQLK